MKILPLVLPLALVTACSARAGGGGGFFVDPDASSSDDASSAGNDVASPGADVVSPGTDVVSPGTDVPEGTDAPVVTDTGATCASDEACGAGRYCEGGACRAQVCMPNTATCSGGNTLSVCDPRGAARVDMPCPGGASCSNGQCQSPRVCEPGAVSCASQTGRRICTPDGTGYMVVNCPSGQLCTGGVCMATQVCTPGVATCGLDGQVQRCNESGTGYTSMPCGTSPNATVSCMGGQCQASCVTGFANCDGDTRNGCEATLASDASNCGSCGRACTAGQTCAAGSCTAGSAGGYTRSTPSLAWIDACTLPGMTRVLPSLDDSAASTTLPFSTFRYWGRAVSAMTVTSNGAIALGSGALSTGGDIPAMATTAILAPWWVDQRTSTSGVCMGVTGVSPSRSYIVQWTSSTNYGDNRGPLTYQVRFNEGTNTIDFVYNAMVTPASGYYPAVGIANWDGSMGVAVCGGITAMTSCGVVTAGTRIRFTPN
ncbi:MAG: hypothetical protein U0325_04885 [Polyangiales bacterium]